jgi:lipopolysaccharide/colanic/teichoic acid biosynthesis glycosyltransferase
MLVKHAVPDRLQGSDSIRSARCAVRTPRAPVALERSPWRRIGQRVFDVAGAALCLALLSPLLAIIALWVKLDSPGRVVFGHERVGLRGRLFHCLKFRSMHEGAERMLQSDEPLHDLYVTNGYKLPARLDPRVTRSGRFLRRSSLDELPQLVNVLRGEMSLVGPRPVVLEELREYDDPDLLLSVRPGITGAWAANGRSTVHYPERARIELAYVQRSSFLLDLKLLVKTVPAVFHANRAP